MKRILLTFTCLFFVVFSYSQQEEPPIDSVAIRLLDKMTSVISELNSVAFDIETETDELNDEKEFQRVFASHKVHMVGPDKMAVRTHGNKGNRMVLYNGVYLHFYSFDENNYVTLKAPDDIMTMVDSMNTTFGIDFPGADLFYPSLTDDILEHFDELHFLGIKVVDGQECFQIQAFSEDMNFQLWIENNPLFMPKKYLIIDKKNQFKQFEGTFSNWEINPVLPNEMFEFEPPKKARLISIQARN